MSSIIRRRRRLIVAIWGSCPEEGRCDNPHPLRQDASAQLPRRPSRAAGSFNPQQWYRARTADARGGTRKTLIVALARKLLIALWRMVTTGEVPAGVVLRAA